FFHWSHHSEQAKLVCLLLNNILNSHVSYGQKIKDATQMILNIKNRLFDTNNFQSSFFRRSHFAIEKLDAAQLKNAPSI
ncbi:MAG TPA: hypothetical protein VHA52_01570, partial [Candidatus Babeliaceae bacterium]|nr:hypothetical protein [Candidatus Babeliaceae bacterium]